jgi:carbon starvation protein
VNPVVVPLICFAGYYTAYRFYARHLRVFELDPNQPTPAHQLRDDINYLPTNRFVLFGHHYAPIAGLSPMLGRRWR